MQVFFTDRAQPVIDNALSVKCKDVEIITVYLDVEPVPFNKGFYSVDITFFFKVTLSAYSSPVVPPATVVGVAAFSKKVILFGSDGNVKVYCSTDPRNCSEHDNTNMPKASVHTVDPKQGYRKGEAACSQSPPTCVRTAPPLTDLPAFSFCNYQKRSPAEPSRHLCQWRCSVA